jgi:hypothetical protein
MRVSMRSLLLLGVVLCGRAALADGPKNPVLVKLAPNQWVKIHEPQPGEMTFRRQPHGGSCFDSKRGRLILFGSDSHGRDFTNSPLFFSTADLKWSRAYENDPLESYRVTDDGLAVAGKQGDHPWAMHTFGAVMYDTSRDEMLVTIFDDHLVPGRFTDAFKDLWPRITRKPTWVFGCENGEWAALPGDGVNCFPYCAAYDSDRRVVVAVRPDGIHELAGTPRTWRKIVDHGFFGWHTNCAYDARHKAVVVFGSNENCNDVAAYFSKTGEYKLMPTPGQRPPKDQHNPMEFHPDLGQTVVLVDRIEGDVKQTETWLYDLGNDAWNQVPAATLPFTCGMNYNLEFDPQHRVLLLVTGGDGAPTRVWAMRLEQASAVEPAAKSVRPSLHRTVDLNIGESVALTLSDGKPATVTLVEMKETRDSPRDAVRRAEVTVEVYGERLQLISATYHLPINVFL